MLTGLVIGSAILLVICALTGVGARRRGARLAASVVQALFFPVTWVAWFVADNHRAGRRAFQGR